MLICLNKDKIYFDKQLLEIVEECIIKDSLGFYYCNKRFCFLFSKCVAICNIEDKHFAVIDITNDCNIVFEEIESSRAFFTIYEGGIFLYQGYTYLVKEMNLYRKIVKVALIKID